MNWIVGYDGGKGRRGSVFRCVRSELERVCGVCARREQLLWGVSGCFHFFLCCGALFLHLTLRCDGDGDGDSDSVNDDVFIAKKYLCTSKALRRALQQLQVQ